MHARTHARMHVPPHRTALHCTAPHHTTKQRNAAQCSAAQRSATQLNVTHSLTHPRTRACASARERAWARAHARA
eukprot:8547976-Alexandrium_andersonii.AAC.1